MNLTAAELRQVADVLDDLNETYPDTSTDIGIQDVDIASDTKGWLGTATYEGDEDYEFRPRFGNAG